MNASAKTLLTLLSLGLLTIAVGCGRNQRRAPASDRPFPLGAVTDAIWESQQTNAEASDFIFYDHEFVGDTAQLAPAAKKHLMQVALWLEHVPFPVVIEESEHNARPELDQQRRKTVVEQLARIGVENAEGRVVIANAYAAGLTAMEGESAYYSTLQGAWDNGGGGTGGRRSNGRGGFYR